MLPDLKKIISRIDADYSDLRYEIKNETRITFRGEEINQLSSNTTDGYVLRVLKNGGLSTIAFTNLKELEKAIFTVCENAALSARHSSSAFKLAPVNALADRFIPELDEDPANVSIDEKLDLTRKYNSIPMKEKNILTTYLEYLEVARHKFFVSTDGLEIEEKITINRINGLITSSDGHFMQNIRVGIGGSNGFSTLRNQEDEFTERTALVLQLLDAKPVQAGTYDVVLNQSLAGVFTHEAFGHFSEADLIQNNPSMRTKMQTGAKLGNDVLNIIDDPTIPDQLGFYKYDDEGIAARPTQLLKNGVLVGRLHSRYTAADFNEPVNGHCVAEDYRFAPIIRMGTIFIQPGGQSEDELLYELKDGLYILDAIGGQTSGENFTFGAQYGYIVRNGKISDMIRDINITGNLYNTLQNIVIVGNDLKLSRIGGCGKGQLNIRSCHGAPHVLVKGVVIGGV
ncbi:Zn-dependent protease [candidate division WOR-3 bacterium RBG_13_43_14]|uniref:Zn-dependent protease n=1 Tax=candidate division WOR-3 bacterium RBG_13_43_14 TaxID=1802590 RepID=A0A1F4UBZ8_UNCW3|nr:MAG: Zn-dependent protease [candidate division WOR-3 bacterium RBG_13_43_14]